MDRLEIFDERYISGCYGHCSEIERNWIFEGDRLMESSAGVVSTGPLAFGNENAEDIIRTLPVPIIHLDPSFAIAFMNPAALQLVGKTEGQVLGRK